MARSAAKPRLGRLGSKRPTAGCTTCKIRKVKCDETHPSCTRCSSTGRKCDGYARETHKSLFAVTMQKPVSVYEGQPQGEIQAFEFFMCQVVPGLGCVMDDDLWHRFIPQVYHSEPAVRHAVSAMSELIRQYHSSPEDKLGADETSLLKLRDTALRWYGRSISDLQHHLERQPVWSATCSITAILYTCIECLMDNVNAAFGIYQKASQAIQAVDHVPTDNHAPSADELSIRASTLALLRHVAASEGLIAATRLKPSNFSSLLEARTALYDIFGQVHAFICQAEVTKAMHSKDWTPPFDLNLQRDYLQAKIDECFSAFWEVPALSKRQGRNELYATFFLAHSQYTIRLSTCLDTWQTTFDPHLPLFQAMNAKAECLIDAMRANGRPIFSFETLLIPTLWYVAIKCRHPTVRRQALNLLRRGPQIENIRKAASWIRTAEKVVAVEESGSECGAFVEHPLSLDYPPERNRIFRLKDVTLPDECGRPFQCLSFTKWQQHVNGEYVASDHLVPL